MSVVSALRYLLLPVFALCCFFTTNSVAAERYAALVVEANSGRVLYEENANSRRYPASLTKMMTLYMVFDALERGKLKLEQRLPVSRRAAARPPTKLGLEAGDSIRVKHAIAALVTQSANDVATVIAEALGKSEFNFSKMMTKKAQALGMRNTRFRNASGLPDGQQYTTAWDMYRLARALQTHFPRYYDYFSLREFSYGKDHHRNHNRLLRNYRGTDGIKTGYIRASGFNLVASVKRGEHHLIGIVFGGRTAKTRDAHLIALLDRGFEHLRKGSPPLRIAETEIPYPLQLVSADPRFSHRTYEPVIAQGSVDQTPTQARSGDWQIQIGAFGQLHAAQQRGLEAQAIAPGLLSADNMSIQALARNGTVIHRLRFGNLSEVDAHTACRLVGSGRLDCVTLSPGS